MKPLYFALLFVLLLPESAFCWGGGHDSVGKAVAQRLPSPWKEKLQQKEMLNLFLVDNHYPDSFEPLEPIRWGERNVRFLADRGITNRYAFHHAQNRPLAFQILIQAIREKNDELTFLALAVLSHSLADQAACNHDPLIHFATYGWGRGALDVCPTLILDAGWLQSQEKNWNIFQTHVDQLDLSDANETLDNVFIQLMGAEWTGTEGYRVDVDIVESAARCSQKKDLDAEEKLANALSILAAWGVEKTVKSFKAAVRFAQSGEEGEETRFDWNQYEKRYQDFSCEYLEHRDITQDSFAVPFLPKPGQHSAIAVLYDPCGKFGEGVFTFLDRILSCQIVGSLKADLNAAIDPRQTGNKTTGKTEGSTEDQADGQTAELPADLSYISLLDIRQIFRDRIDAKQTRLIIVPATRLNSYHQYSSKKLVQQLIDFQKQGGKILWIGSLPPRALSGIEEKYFERNPEKEGYCKPVFPVSLDDYRNSRLAMVGTCADCGTVPDGEAPLNGKADSTASIAAPIAASISWPVLKKPLGQAGWIWFGGPYSLAESYDPEIDPFLELQSPDKNRVVGLAYPKSAPRLVWIPSYALFPYVYTNERPQLNPLKLKLDRVGEFVLKQSVRKLAKKDNPFDK